MQNFNGSNAFKMRSSAAPKKKKSGVKKRTRTGQRKHIQPNMTVRLNKTKRPAHVKSTERIAEPIRSMNNNQLRLLFGAGLVFSVLLLFFVVTVNLQIRENELSHEIKAKKKVLAELESEHSGLTYTRDTILNKSTVEAYAEQRLGMLRPDNYQVQWFTVEDEDEPVD